MKPQKTNIKRIALFVFVSIVALAVLVTLIMFLGKHYPEKTMSFFEDDAPLMLSESEKQNMYEYLDRYYVSDEKVSGFVAENRMMSLYAAYSIAKFCEAVNRPDLLDGYKNAIICALQTNPENLNVLNLNYYVYLCRLFDVGFDDKQVKELYARYYDNDTKLFYLNNANERIETKTTITGNCCEAYPELIDNEKFDIKSGASALLNDGSFKTDTKKTFYNSGAQVIYLYNILGMINDNILSERKEWFDAWKKYYENLAQESEFSILAYGDFYEIATMYDEDYSDEVLKKYYVNNGEKMVRQTPDLLMLAEELSMVNVSDNPSALELFDEALENYAVNLKSASDSVDILSTYYGICLADAAGYEYDEGKIRNLIDLEYEAVKELPYGFDRINRLYYTLNLDRKINGSYLSIDVKTLAELVKEDIKHFNSLADVYQKMQGLEKITGIIVIADSEGYDISLNNFLFFKLKAAARKLAQEEGSMASYVWIADRSFGFNVCKEDYLEKSYEKAYAGGGVSLNEEGAVPQIDLTYGFFEGFDDKSKMDGLQLFVNGLELEDGIYAYDESRMFCNFESIYFGNVINSYFEGR